MLSGMQSLVDRQLYRMKRRYPSEYPTRFHFAGDILASARNRTRSINGKTNALPQSQSANICIYNIMHYTVYFFLKSDTLLPSLFYSDVCNFQSILLNEPNLTYRSNRGSHICILLERSVQELEFYIRSSKDKAAIPKES